MTETPSDPLAAARELWSGSTAVITGAGSGLGAGLARVAARDLGMSVVVADVDERRAAEVAAAISESGGQARHVVVDVRRYEEVESLADSVYRDDGPIGLLANNAGVEHVAVLWEQPVEAWHRVVDVNLSGVYHGVRAFVPRMIEAARPGVVLNIASVGALSTARHHGVYQVTKHGVLALSEVLADELRAAGVPVRVAVALPGPVRTRIYADSNDGAPAGDGGGAGDTSESPSVRELDAMRTLLHDQGMEPEEAARTMLAQIAAGAFAVTTHPDWLQNLVRSRSARILQLAEPPVA